MPFMCVILAHTDEAPPTLVYLRVRVEPFAFRSDRRWWVGPADPIDPLVGEIRVVDKPARTTYAPPPYS